MNFWKMLKGDLAGARAAPPTDFGMHSPAAPSMLPPPTGHAPDPRINHVLPLRWSLSYALTEKQWKEMRQRFQSYFPDWMRCKQCPKGCLAKSLDEQWKYDHATFTKILIGAEFICGGCHWLKTPPFRIKTWLEQQRRLVPPMTKPPHIIDCLGWTQEKLDELRHQDLEMHRREQAGRLQLFTQLKDGRATVAQTPIEQMPSNEREAWLRSGQTIIVPWRVDLSSLAEYGYTPSMIAAFETRMYKLAEKRMASAF